MKKKVKSLVVEDSSITAKDLKMSLEDLGYIVTAMAASGEDAIKKVDNERPDLILMDIKLEGKMDGIDTANRINTELHFIPIIYLTGFTDKEMVNRAKITEAFGYLLKPYRVLELQTNIEMALSKHAMEEERRGLVVKLHGALADAEDLQGLLSICSCCKKVKEDNDNWTQIEKYIADNIDARLSHFICPSCAKKNHR